jgi:hypothetical protein
VSFEKNKVKYFLSAEERQAISHLIPEYWKKIYVQAGKISDNRPVEPHVYSVGPIIIETKTQLLLLIDSEELDDGTELFTIAAVEDRDELQIMLSRMHPPVEELVDCPTDLNINLFLGVHNKISLLRFNEFLEEDTDHVYIERDSGLLIANTHGRLLLYPNQETPLEFCITTNPIKIDSVLNKVDIIPLDK